MDQEFGYILYWYIIRVIILLLSMGDRSLNILADNEIYIALYCEIYTAFAHLIEILFMTRITVCLCCCY